MSERSLALLGGALMIEAYDLDPTMEEALFDSLLYEGRRLEKIFNFFDPKSELNILNRKRQARVSPELREVLALALRLCLITQGAYDISLGRLFLARKHKKPLPKLNCSYKDISLEGDTMSLNHPDVLVDLGSIAKGYIVDKLVEAMREAGIERGFVDSRGDMRVFGGSETVEIQDPRDPKKTVVGFLLEESAVATSGDYHQFDGAFEQSHIINQKDLASVTVVAPSAVLADALATCAFVMGSAHTPLLLDQFPYVNVTTIHHDGTLMELRGDTLVH